MNLTCRKVAAWIWEVKIWGKIFFLQYVIIYNNNQFILSLNGFSQAQSLHSLRRLQINLNHNKSNQMLVFGVRGKLEYPGKTSQNRVGNQPAQSTHDSRSGNQSRAILVEGECCHHYANPALYIICLRFIYYFSVQQPCWHFGWQ